jgi:membrane peptidoglycan carboxypeptidase
MMHYGAVSVRTALANSLNIPAVKAINYAGISHVQDLAHRMGMTESLYGDASMYGSSLALGSGEVTVLEHTNVFATFANEGVYVPANPILKITDARGNVIYDAAKELQEHPGTQALRAEYAYQITSILTDNDARSMIFTENNLFGNTASELGRPTAAKSGTTDSWKDIWTMGYTTDLAIGVWMGQTTATGDRLPELSERDGIQGAGPIWADMMLEMHQNPQWADLLKGPNGQTIPEDFPVPAGIYEGDVCVSTGHQATSGYESQEEVLVRGEGPALSCGQLSAYEYDELQKGMEDLDRNGGSYTGRGQDTMRRYADAVESGDDDRWTGSGDDGSPQIEQRGGSTSGDSTDSDNSDSGSGSDFSNDSTDSGGNGDTGDSEIDGTGTSPPIEPRDN